MSWYHAYGNKPTIKTDQGIQAQSKRGAFVKNWWAQQWLQAMEQLMDRGRLARGRQYARKGQVLSLTEATGGIEAKVQGSRTRPYKISIKLTPFTEQQWGQILDSLTSRPIFMAQLLAGEMPADINEALAAIDLSLFPSRHGELTQACNCPDWAEVCKHLAAVHYILAERFDEDPFLIFRLRGQGEEAIFELLRQQQGEGHEGELLEPVYEPAKPLTASVADFWGEATGGVAVTMHIEPPATAYPVLVRLGEPAFLPEIERWLKPAYEAMSAAALALAAGDDNDEQESEK